jgi:hypothetical protein
MSIGWLSGAQAVLNSRRTIDRIDEILKAAENPLIEIVSLWG